MSNTLFRSRSRCSDLHPYSLPISVLVCLAVGGLFLALQSPWGLLIAIAFSLTLHFQKASGAIASRLTGNTCFSRSRSIGILIGLLLFVAITSHSDPALAQLFDTAQSEVESIFGQYLDSGIITFLFGLIRVVVWIAAVGFVFFAVYQAQRGEQWQPLAQNAFIVVAAVVLVEGLSTLFFGS